jgi:serine/threonine protein kinase
MGIELLTKNTMLCPSCQGENEDGDAICFHCGVVLARITQGALIDGGRYEILDKLGKGGMGAVYKARDLVLNELVALKVLRTDVARDPELAKRFLSEIRLARKVQHTNICRIHDYGEEGPIQFISMQYVDGEDLHRRLRDGPLPIKDAYAVSIAVANGLEAIHAAGIVHRDLKPSNIMRDRTGKVWLMDFGIAKEWAGSSPMTTTGHVIGTPEYMSPEQATGRRVDFRSDLYSLGVVVFELFTGRVPFHGDDPIAIVLKHLKEPPPLDGFRATLIPDPVIPVLNKALAKTPEARYTSAAEMANALALAQAATPDDFVRRPLGPSLPPPTLTTRFETRRGRPWRSLTLALSVAAVLAVALLLPRRLPERKDTPANVVASVPHASLPLADSTPTAPSNVPVGVSPALVRDVTAARGVHHQRPLSPSAVATAAPSPRPEPSAEPAEPSASATQPAAEATPNSTGILQISVRPWAEVLIDGKVAGFAPLRSLPLAVGNHFIRLIHPDYQPLVRVVEIRPGETTTLRVDLKQEGLTK